MDMGNMTQMERDLIIWMIGLAHDRMLNEDGFSEEEFEVLSTWKLQAEGRSTVDSTRMTEWLD